ncbi:MAG: hypothetical protein ACXWV0_10565 [Flavisolibacter sp.]
MRYLLFILLISCLGCNDSGRGTKTVKDNTKNKDTVIIIDSIVK